MNSIATVNLLKPSIRLQRMSMSIYTVKFDYMAYDICNCRSIDPRTVFAEVNTSCGVFHPGSID